MTHHSTLIVIPCLNEEKTIGPLLNQLAENRPSPDTPIVVVDGGSTDATIAIVTALADNVENVFLVPNPRTIQSAGINLAVELFGENRDYVIRIDAHGSYPDDYCTTLVQEAVLQSADSVVVGMRTVGYTDFQKAAAAAQNSLLGTGGSAHRVGAGGSWVDHGHHALMSIAAFRSVGGYDPTFSHNEDAELDLRLRAAGYRIWMTAKTSMVYYPRSSPTALFKQYLRYGRGRAKNVLKHRSVPKLRQALPLGVVPAVALAALSPVTWLAAIPAGTWLAVCTSYGLAKAVQSGDRSGVLIPVAVADMHLAWSAGFWLELAGVGRRKLLRPTTRITA